MMLFDIFQKLFGAHKTAGNTDEENYRLMMLYFVLLLSSIITFIIAFISFVFFDAGATAYLNTGYFVICLSFLFVLKITRNYQLVAIAHIIFFMLLFSLIILFYPKDNAILMWGIFLPVTFSFLVDYRKYALYSFLFLILNYLTFLGIYLFRPDSYYSFKIILRYSVIYILLYSFFYFYLKLQQQASNRKEKHLIELNHKLLEKDKYISSLSYDLRLPLSNIMGILNHQRDTISQNVAEGVEMSINTLAAILNKIAEKSNVDSLRLTGQKTEFDIVRVIQKLIRLFEVEAYSKLRINLSVAQDVSSTVYADRISFMQIILSTIDFLFSYSEKESLRINISVSKSENNLFLIKFKPETKKTELLDILNNLSEHLKSNKELQFIQETAETLNGGISEVEDPECFCLLLNFNFTNAGQKTDSSEDFKPFDLHKPATDKKVMLKDATVLLVEDDVFNADVMIMNLEGFVNNIVTAGNGKVALEKFSETKIDIVLTDIQMPIMDGFKMAKKIREAELGTDIHIPIIAVTANVSPEVKERCLETGMNEYVPKPVNYNLLLKMMKNLLEK